MERKTIEENKNSARDYAVLVGLRSPVLGADSADEESLAWARENLRPPRELDFRMS